MKEFEKKLEDKIKEIYSDNGMFKLNKKNAPYVVKIVDVLKGLTTNSASQILKEVEYILPKISTLWF